MRIIFSTLILITFFPIAKVEAKSAFFWQAQKKEFYLFSSLHLTAIKATYRDFDWATVSQSGPTIVGGAEYGITKKISAYISTEYTRQKIKYKPMGFKYDYKGIGDINVGVKGVRPFKGKKSRKNLRYGLGYSFSLGEKIIAYGDQNNKSGHDSIKPYVGFERFFNDMTAGIQIGGTLYTQDQKINNEGVEQKLSGGETAYAALFAEREVRKAGIIGSSLQYVYRRDSKDTDGTKYKSGNTYFWSIYGDAEPYESVGVYYQAGYVYTTKTTVLEATKGFLGYVGFRYKF